MSKASKKSSKGSKTSNGSKSDNEPQMSPEDALIKGKAFFNEKKYQEAIDCFKRYLESDMDNQEIQALKTKAEYLLRRMKGTAANIQTKIFEVGEHAYQAGYYYRTATEAAAAGQVDVAVDNLQRAIALDISFRARAQKDAAFNPIRDQVAFKALMEEKMEVDNAKE